MNGRGNHSFLQLRAQAPKEPGQAPKEPGQAPKRAGAGSTKVELNLFRLLKGRLNCFQKNQFETIRAGAKAF